MKMPIRVLQVVTYMQRGGLETMLMNYYRNIDRSKVQFDFLVHRDFEADYDSEILELGGRIYRLPVLNPIGAEYLGKLDQFYKDHPEYRIVHSHLDCLAGIPLKYAKKNKVPVRIAHAHNNNQTMNWKYPIKLFFRRNITKYANHLLACSREAGNWMFRTNRFEVLNNAIDAKQYIYDKNVRDRIKKELHIERNKLVFGHIGRFLTQKNHKFLIEVFKKIVEMHPDSILLLVGDGELQQNIKEKVQQIKKELLANAVERNGVKVIVFKGEAHVETIKDIAFQVKGEAQEDGKVFFVGGIKDGTKCALMVSMSEPLVKEGLNAGKLVKDAAKLIQGGGGGQPHFATAGGKNPDGLDAAIDAVLEAAGLK